MSKSRHKAKRRKPTATASTIAANPQRFAQSNPAEAPVAEEARSDGWVRPKYLPIVRGLMLALLMLGLAWRFVGVKWDAGNHLHPDERFLTTLADLRLPSSLSDWFRTATSGFNPFNKPQGPPNLFVYGQLPLLIGKLVAGRFDADNYDGILIVGRVLSALFDVGTVGFVWLAGRRLLGRDGGLLAAVLLAFTALHIQLSHFYTVDTFASFFLAASFWALLRWLDDPRARWALFAGCAWGLSVACKISTVLFAPIVLLALVLGLARVVRRRHEVSEVPKAPAASVGGVLASALALGVVALVCFRLGHPMAFRGEAGPLGGLFDLRPPSTVNANNTGLTFWTSFAEQRDITSGDRDVPYSLQFFGRKNILWPLRNLLVWGIGWQALVPALAAMLWLPWRVARRQENAAWLLAVAWIAFGFGYNAMQFSKFSRYFLVVTPFCALLSAWFAVRACEWARQAHLKYLQRDSVAAGSDWRRHLPLGAALLVGAMLGGTVCWGSAVASIYTVPHTRVAATEFLNALPQGTRIANESDWDDTLPLGDQSRFQMQMLHLVNHEDAAWRDSLIDSIDRSDWVVTSSQRMWGSLPRVSMRYPLSTAYYRALFSGQLGLVPEREFTAYPELNLFGWRIDFPDDYTDEALTVYDHPRVLLWHKGASWSAERARSILDLALLDKRDDAPLKDLIARGAQVDEGSLPWMPSPAPAP